MTSWPLGTTDKNTEIRITIHNFLTTTFPTVIISQIIFIHHCAFLLSFSSD